MARFGVVNTLTGEMVHRTKVDPSYYDGHVRAEKWARLNLKSNSKIVELLDNGTVIHF